MKKTLGICLMVMGILSFLVIGYVFLGYMMMTKEILIAKYGAEITRYYKEGIDQHLHNGRIATGIVTSLSIVTIFLGYRMFKSEKK